MRVSHIDQEFKELKPCPFCGSKPIWWLKGNAFTKSQFITVKCPKCRIQRTYGIINGNGHDITWLENIAIKHWNERTGKAIIDKACEWLVKNLWRYIYVKYDDTAEGYHKFKAGCDLNELIDDFRKYMEEKK